MSFNLMITHEPGLENFRFVLAKLRNTGLNYVLVDKGPSVILLKVDDPYDFTSRIREAVNEIQVIYRVIPIDVVTDPYVEIVAEKSRELALEKIPVDKTYRVTLHGRLYWLETRLPAHTMDAIRVIADKIDRQVSLTHPDYLVYIRSVKLYHRRRYATITVTSPSNIIALKSDKP
ncbi:THUMP domain-containing protein [Desulfurococcus amylolyticus]|nr:THUMP domain-containing protein [Desulfurococcus amylolyticus]